MKIHKKTKSGILCNAVKMGKDWFITKNNKKVTCKKCFALLKGVHIGEVYQYKIPDIKLTDSDVYLISSH